MVTHPVDKHLIHKRFVTGAASGAGFGWNDEAGGRVIYGAKSR